MSFDGGRNDAANVNCLDTERYDDTVDNPLRTSEAAAGGNQGGAQAVEGRPRQGSLAGRQVAQQEERGRGLSVDESREARVRDGAALERRGLGSRLVSMVVSAIGSSRRSAATQQRPQSDEAAGPQRSARREELPWLTAHENSQRRRLADPAIDAQELSGIPKIVRDDLFAKSAVTYEKERLLFHVHNLHRKSRTQLLSEDDWSNLCSLGSRLKQDIPRAQAEIRRQLSRTRDSDVLSPAARRLLQELERRLEKADCFLRSNEAGWNDTVRYVESELPISLPNRVTSTTQVDVQSRVVPGTALGSCLATGYPSADSVNSVCPARYKHVPELAQTVLKNRKEQVLFAGLRHGIVSTGELDGKQLARLPDAELQPLVAELVIAPDSPLQIGGALEPRIRERCGRIRSGERWANSSAATISRNARLHMARESAAAALVADHGNLRRALDGELVDVNLFSISLLERQDVERWSDQERAFTELSEGGPIELQVRDPNEDGAVRSVVVNVKVRQFVLAVRGVRLDARARRAYNQAVEVLVGPRGTTDLKGELAARLEAMNARIAGLSNRFVVMDQQHAQLVQQQGANHPDAAALNISILELREERELLEKNARTLKDAGKQLRVMWAGTSRFSIGAESQQAVAARLALVGHLMQETPVLICMRGKDFARQLDPEIKFLATVADNLSGHLPLVEERMEKWRPARAAFGPH